MTVVAAVMVPVMAAGLLLWVLFFGTASPAAAACATTPTGRIDVDSISAGATVAGLGRAQLVNAALIVNAAAALGLDGSAQLLGVQTAIGESSLIDVDHGDGAINPDGSIADSLGLFQQQSSWGTVAQRMDPTTAATLFFRRLRTVSGWEQMVPTLAINTVQGNADPDFYTPFRSSAAQILNYLSTLDRSASPTPTTTVATGTTTGISSTAASSTAVAAAGCGAMSGNARSLAQQLMREIKAGRLTELEPEYQREIADVAAGTQSASCGLDPRTLQIIQLALNTFQTVGISDLNRRCTGSLLGAGTESAHWINGGGQAVDFYAFNGTALTGGDPLSMRFLHVLDPVVPAGARAGQAECRSAATFAHLTQFDDTCNHLHIDVAFTNGAALTLTG